MTDMGCRLRKTLGCVLDTQGRGCNKFQEHISSLGEKQENGHLNWWEVIVL